MSDKWYKFSPGEFIVWRTVVHKVISVTSDGPDNNLYSIDRLHTKAEFPVRNVPEKEISEWNGTVSLTKNSHA